MMKANMIENNNKRSNQYKSRYSIQSKMNKLKATKYNADIILVSDLTDNSNYVFPLVLKYAQI